MSRDARSVRRGRDLVAGTHRVKGHIVPGERDAYILTDLGVVGDGRRGLSMGGSRRGVFSILNEEVILLALNS